LHFAAGGKEFAQIAFHAFELLVVDAEIDGEGEEPSPQRVLVGVEVAVVRDVAPEFHEDKLRNAVVAREAGTLGDEVEKIRILMVTVNHQSVDESDG